MKPGSWSSIISVFLFGVLGAATVSKVVPLAGDFAREFGTTPRDFGWFVSLIGLTALILAIPSGLMVDRYGSRRVLQGSVVLGILANVIYMLAPTYHVMQVARFVEGAAIVHIYSAAPAFLMATSEGKQRASAMSVWATYMPIGSAAGLLLAGSFAGTANWRMTFVLHGALYVLVWLLNLRQPQVSMNTGPAGASTLGQRLLDLRNAYSRPAILLFALAFFLMISLGFGANTTFPGYLAAIHHVPVATASRLLALGVLLMIPGSLGAGALIASGVRQSVLFTALGVVGAIVGCLSFFPDLTIPLRFVVVGAWFVISGAAVAALMATLPLVAEPQRRGAAAGLLNQAGATATFVNPPIWLPLAAAGGWLPFAALMIGGWVVSVASVWGLSTFKLPGSEK
jgi:predicted MFS family arabinose efflux permease